jgi:hypothetical protein
VAYVCCEGLERQAEEWDTCPYARIGAKQSPGYITCWLLSVYGNIRIWVENCGWANGKSDSSGGEEAHM